MSERQSGARAAHVVSAGLTQNVWDVADLTLKLRFARALEEGATRYPIHRSVRFAARARRCWSASPRRASASRAA